MRRIFWDTNLFIYLFEDYADLSVHVDNLRRKMLAHRDQLFTSTFTLGEILVKPLEMNRPDLAKRYEDALMTSTVMLPFNSDVARRYAAIRQDRQIRPPDAIQLACASHAQIDLFVTNDRGLSKKRIHGISTVVTLTDL